MFIKLYFYLFANLCDWNPFLFEIKWCSIAVDFFEYQQLSNQNIVFFNPKHEKCV